MQKTLNKQIINRHQKEESKEGRIPDRQIVDEKDLKIKRIRKNDGMENINTQKDINSTNFIYRKSERGTEKNLFCSTRQNIDTKTQAS